MTSLFVGSKIDDLSYRHASYQALQATADQYGLPYIECSAKEKINIDLIFIMITRILVFQRSDYTEKLNHYLGSPNLLKQSTTTSVRFWKKTKQKLKLTKSPSFFNGTKKATTNQASSMTRDHSDRSDKDDATSTEEDTSNTSTSHDM